MERDFDSFAFSLGAKQYRAGSDRHANPYKVKTSSWNEWNKGWNSEAKQS